MKEYDFYLFDFDGTLVDSRDSLFLVYQEAFKCADVTVTREEVEVFMKETIDISYFRKTDKADKLDDFMAVVNTFMHNECVTKANKTFPETKQFLDELHKRNKVLGLVTHNNTQHIVDVLNHLNLDPSYFAISIGHSEVTKFKPDPQGILLALDKLGYDKNKHRACYVGDSINDMKAANAAGIDSIFVYRHHNLEDKHEGKISVNSLLEILEY